MGRKPQRLRSAITFCSSPASCIQRLLSIWASGLENPLDSMESLSIPSACNTKHAGGQGAARGLCEPAGGSSLFISRGMRNLPECLTPINWLAWGKILANTGLVEVSKPKTASWPVAGILRGLGLFQCGLGLAEERRWHLACFRAWPRRSLL